MNHGSNRSERYIISLNDIITKCLVGTGNYWPLYIAPATFAMNCQVSQVTGFSPFQMVYSKPPPEKLAFDFDPIKSGILVTYIYFTVIEHKTLYGLRVHTHNISPMQLMSQSLQLNVKATTNNNNQPGPYSTRNRDCALIGGESRQQVSIQP